MIHFPWSYAGHSKEQAGFKEVITWARLIAVVGIHVPNGYYWQRLCGNALGTTACQILALCMTWRALHAALEALCTRGRAFVFAAVLPGDKCA